MANNSQSNFVYNNNHYYIEYNNNDCSGPDGITEIVTNNDYLLNNFNNIESKIFVDIGANLGIASIILAKQNPNSVIYSFEPCKKTYNILINNIKLNNLNNVKAYNLAVTKPGIEKLKLYKHFLHSGANTTYGNNNIDSHTSFKSGYEEVECISFDDIIKNNNIDSIELLKIDCEGAEYDILYSSEYFKNNYIKNMVGEFHKLNWNINEDPNKLLEYSKKYVNGIFKISILHI